MVTKFGMLSVGGREGEEREREEERAGRGGEERDLGERRVIVNIEGGFNYEDIGIEILRGYDGMNDFPKQDVYDYDSREEEGSIVISEEDTEMPTLEVLVVGEETSGEEDIVLDEEEEIILPSQL